MAHQRPWNYFCLSRTLVWLSSAVLTLLMPPALACGHASRDPRAADVFRAVPLAVAKPPLTVDLGGISIDFPALPERAKAIPEPDGSVNRVEWLLDFHGCAFAAVALKLSAEDDTPAATTVNIIIIDEIARLRAKSQPATVRPVSAQGFHIGDWSGDDVNILVERRGEGTQYWRLLFGAHADKAFVIWTACKFVTDTTSDAFVNSLNVTAP